MKKITLKHMPTNWRLILGFSLGCLFVVPVWSGELLGRISENTETPVADQSENGLSQEGGLTYRVICDAETEDVADCHLPPVRDTLKLENMQDRRSDDHDVNAKSLLPAGSSETKDDDVVRSEQVSKLRKPKAKRKKQKAHRTNKSHKN